MATEHLLKTGGIVLIVIMMASVIGLLTSSVTTEWHEFLGHTMVAKTLGCNAHWWGNAYSGMTDFSCKTNNPVTHILIAFGSIFVVFFISLALILFAGDNSMFKFIGFIGALYSCIPSAYPLLRGSDMFYIISRGFPPVLAWAIYALMSGTTMWLLMDEVMDRDTFSTGFKTWGFRR